MRIGRLSFEIEPFSQGWSYLGNNSCGCRFLFMGRLSLTIKNVSACLVNSMTASVSVHFVRCGIQSADVIDFRRNYEPF